MTRRTILSSVVVLATGLAAHAQQKQGEKRYSMKGQIKSLDAKAKSASIDAGPIVGWMGAMTMSYSIKPDAEFEKLHVGDSIEATVVVQGDGYYVTEVKVAAPKK